MIPSEPEPRLLDFLMLTSLPISHKASSPSLFCGRIYPADPHCQSPRAQHSSSPPPHTEPASSQAPQAAPSLPNTWTVGLGRLLGRCHEDTTYTGLLHCRAQARPPQPTTHTPHPACLIRALGWSSCEGVLSTLIFLSVLSTRYVLSTYCVLVGP